VSFTIRVAGSDIRFPCEDEESVLDAALAAGWELPYSCKRGQCENCRGRVVSGEFHGPTTFGGDALLCQAHPRSDLEIAPREIRRHDPNARKTIDARVYRVERPAADVAAIHLRFPPGVRAKWKAGQYLEVILEDAARRSFSMANPPQQSDGALLHVRVLSGGRFSDKTLSTLREKDVLRIELPFGDFYLRDAERPAILVASGTGFAPIKAILEDAWKRGVQRDLTLYWGARRQEDLYQLALPQKWAAERPRFKFIPVLSEQSWPGRTGLVHRAVMDDHASLADVEIYACGVPAMVDAARRDFIAERSLPPDAFFCDSFATSAPPCR
jgi:NAD(P)H-flavin reductase/ferredoxin